MALTPHVKDPNRGKHLRAINEMMDAGSEGKGRAKQAWNVDAKPKSQGGTTPPVKDPTSKDSASKDGGKGK